MTAGEAAAPLASATPEAVGISSARLEHLHRYMEEAVSSGRTVGAVTLIARHGQMVDWRAFGHQDLARRSPLARDAIFQVYSMTKVIASVAALMLVEEGKLALDEPVARRLPEFADMQVYVGGSADAPELRPAARPITVRHLLIHAAGFATDENDPSGARTLFDSAQLHASRDLEQYCATLGQLPLAADPGSRFAYDGAHTVVLSRLVEVSAGMAFGDFLRERLFEPLGMKDTGFEVPASERARVVEMTTTDATGRLIAAPTAPGRGGTRLYPFDSAAAGLYSTTADYARFAQMLLNGGTLDGRRILGRKTVELMLMNHLPSLVPPRDEHRAGEGFGLGGFVVLDPARRGKLGSVGQFGWPGAASTYFAIDRREGVLAMVLMQSLPGPAGRHDIATGFYNLVYQALAD